MQLTGSEIILQCLIEQGVDTVFGYPGGTIINVYDALYRYSDKITHILTSHEQGAAHAADGYARATGRVGVCMATSGPGATNLVTGIATAYMDSIPVVAITCNVGVPQLARDSFQEVDIFGVTMPITKHNFIVKDVNILADTIRRAFTIAKSGRPGPVLVDITKDVTSNKAEFEPVTPEPVKRKVETIREEDIDKALELLTSAKKPYLFVGGGAVAANASEEVREFAAKMNAPITDSLMGKGAIDGRDPLYTGMLGMHGTKTSNYFVNRADLLIVIGSRFSDRIYGNVKKFARHVKILQFDVDPAEINKNVLTAASVIGDLKVILQRINERLPQQDHSEWIAEVKEYEAVHPLTYPKGKLTGPYIIEKIYSETKGDAIIATDVGQHQMWAAQFYRYHEPRVLLTSGGLGTMGFGLGAAMGAKLGKKDKIVFNISGDGCFRMNMNELATLTRYNIPVIDVIINNHVLGMVHQWQDLFYGQRYSQTLLNDKVNFAKVAEGLGAKSYTVRTCEEFDAALRDAIALNVPAVIDAQIDTDEKVFPMVAPGAPISECFSEEDLAEKFGR